MFEVSLPALSVTVVAGMLLIFAMRVVDVSLGTIRMIMVMRGMRLWAVIIGFVEITIWVLAVSQVITNLDNLWNILGYSGGFALGTLVGMWLEDRLALGLVDIHVVSLDRGEELVTQLRQAGYGVTELRGRGRSGEVAVLAVVASRREAKRVLRLIEQIDHDSFITIDDMRAVKRGYLRTRAL